MANLWLLQSKGSLLEVLKRCKGALDRLISTSKAQDMAVINAGIQIPGSGSTTPHLVQPPEDIVDAFNNSQYFEGLPSKVRKLSYVKVNGLLFSVSSRHRGNSQVMLEDSKGRLQPCIIQYILQRPDGSKGVYVILHSFKPALVQSNPYSGFPIFGANLWSQELSDNLQIMDARMLKHHFVCCDCEWKGANVPVVVPLSWIR